MFRDDSVIRVLEKIILPIIDEIMRKVFKGICLVM